MVRRILLLCVMAFVVAGCGSNPEKQSNLAANGPDWVNRGNGAFSGNQQKAFYGVGSVNGVRNRSLAITAADNRARSEVGKIFETYTASMMKDYARSTTAGDMNASSEEQDIQNSVKTFSATTLSGVMIVDHWRDPSDGTIYSLARLNIDEFKSNIDKARELSAAVRDYVRANADKAFDDLSAEEQKRGGKQ